MILLLSAMPEEIAALRPGLTSSELQFGAGREFALGAIDAQPVVLADRKSTRLNSSHRL